MLMGLVENFFIKMWCSHKKELVMSVRIMCVTMSMRITVVIIVTMIIVSCRPTYFMKLDTIVGILGFFIKTNMREIVPDREDCRIDYVGEKNLIEHQKYPKWDDSILMCHDIEIYGGILDHIDIVRHISKPHKKCPRFKNICLFYHIYSCCKHRIEKKYTHKNMQHRIECRMCRFCNDESTMYRKEYRQYVDKIDSKTHDKHRKTEWKKTTPRSECWIPKKKYGKEYIDPESYNSTKRCFKNLMQREKIIRHSRKSKNQEKEYNIKIRNLKCRCKR